jgi:hypothetical protein
MTVAVPERLHFFRDGGPRVRNPPPSSGESTAFRDLPRRARRSSRRLADASLYQRFHALGWKELQCFPQLVAVRPGSPRLARYQQQILAALSPAETEAWRRATAKGHTSSPSPSIAQSGPNLPEKGRAWPPALPLPRGVGVQLIRAPTSAPRSHLADPAAY